MAQETADRLPPRSPGQPLRSACLAQSGVEQAAAHALQRRHRLCGAADAGAARFRERAFSKRRSASYAQLDGDLFVLRASKYRFGDEDPFARARSRRSASASPGWRASYRFMPRGRASSGRSRGATKPTSCRPSPSIPTGRCFCCPRSMEQRELLKQRRCRAGRPPRAPFLGMGGDARETEINGRAVQIVGASGSGPIS